MDIVLNSNEDNNIAVFETNHVTKCHKKLR